MASPRPKPTALKLLEGNPGKRTLSEDEPRYPTLTIDRAPERLTPEAKKLWLELGNQLCQIGLLQIVDSNLFERYCDLFAKWLIAKDFLDKNGTSYTTMKPVLETDGNGKWRQKMVLNPKTGVREPATKPDEVKRFPQVRDYMELSDRLLKVEQEMGLTPAARSKLRVPEGGGGKYGSRKPGSDDPFGIDDTDDE